MNPEVIAAGGDARRLLADVLDLAHRVRPAQRVTWLPPLVLAHVVIAAGYMRAARNRGLGSRALPYVLTGGVLVLASAAPTGVLIFALAYLAVVPQTGHGRSRRRLGFGPQLLISGGMRLRGRTRPAGSGPAFRRTRLPLTAAHLSRHVGVLETAGLVEVDRDREGSRGHTWITLTPAGTTAFTDEIRRLKQLIARVEPTPEDE